MDGDNLVAVLCLQSVRLVTIARLTSMVAGTNQALTMSNGDAVKQRGEARHALCTKSQCLYVTCLGLSHLKHITTINHYLFFQFHTEHS